MRNALITISSLVTIVLVMLVSSTNTIGHSNPIPMVITQVEQRVIDARTYRVGFSADMRPLTFVEGQTTSGVSLETMKLIERKTTLKLEYVQFPTQADVLNAMKRGEIDIMTTTMDIVETQGTMNHTLPYKHVNTIMLVKQAPITFPMVVGHGFEYAVTPTLQALGSQVQLRAFNNNDDAFVALKDGLIGAVVMDEISFNYLDRKYGQQFQKLEVNFEYALSFGVQTKEPGLLALLNRAILTLTKKERQQILRSSGIVS